MIIDLIILLVIGLTCYTSYKKGLLLTLYKIISFFLAIWIAWVINPVVKGGLTKYTNIETWLETNISEGITRTIDNSLISGGNKITGDDDDDEKVDEKNADKTIEDLKVPNFVKSYLKSKLENDSTKKEISNFVSKSLTNICLTIISFILVILIVALVLSLLKGILQMISNIPIIDIINKIAGAGFGLMLSAIEIWLVFLLIGLAINVNSESALYGWISNSTLGSWFFNNNLISYVIVKILG